MSTAIVIQNEAGAATAARQPVRSVSAWGFLALGFCLSVLGLTLPGIRASFGLTLSEAGLLVVVNAVGYLISVFVGGLAADRWGRRRVLMVGAGTLIVGVAAFGGAPTWPLALAGITLVGAGEGVVDGALNALLNEHSGEHRGADLNLAHGFSGIGAVLGPLVAGSLLMAGFSWRWLYVPAAVVTLGLIWLACRLPLRHERVTRADAATAPALVVFRAPVVWLLGLVLCLYAGVEMMVGTWSFTHLREGFGADDAGAGATTALYWGGITLGRFIMGTIGARVSAHRMIIGNVLAASVALLLLVAAPTLPLAVVGLALVGLALANIYPAVVAVAGAAYPRAVGAVTGALIAAGGLGTAIFPWLTGVAAEGAGLSAALAGGLGLLLVMLVAQITVISLQRRAQARDELRRQRASRARLFSANEQTDAVAGRLVDAPSHINRAFPAGQPVTTPALTAAGAGGANAARTATYAGISIGILGLLLGVALAQRRRVTRKPGG